MKRKTLSPEYNLKVIFPEIAKEWDYKKNDLRPEECTPHKKLKVWWICPKKHGYEADIGNRTAKIPMGCSYCASKKVGYGNDLKTNFPAVAKEWDFEKNEKKPSEVFPKSLKKYWWICPKNHSYETTPASRTKPQGCPYCSGNKVGYGNDLETNFPSLVKEWDFKKNEKKPSEITPSHGKKVWWLCPKKHSYDMPPSSRTIKNKKKAQGCPFCSGKRAGYGNDLKSKYPKAIKEWDYKKNKFKPEEVTHGTKKLIWWKCKNNHSWQDNAYTRNRYSWKCPYCTKQRASNKYNFKTENPKLLKEWDFKKNKKTPTEYLPHSNISVWWICPKNHNYKSQIYRRSNGEGCVYCAGKKVGQGNDLATNYPELIKEWDFEKNKIKPSEIMPRTHKKIWWICSKGHSYVASTNSRLPSIKGKKLVGSNCPYCTLTPRSRDEIYLLFELKNFLDISEDDHKIKLKKIIDVDIKIPKEKIIIEFDGAYWHKDKADKDKSKTNNLRKAGWTVIRIREKPLKILSRKYNLTSKSGDYKETANKVLKKLVQLGYEVKNLDKYLSRKTLVNKKQADIYIEKLLQKK